MGYKFHFFVSIWSVQNEGEDKDEIQVRERSLLPFKMLKMTGNRKIETFSITMARKALSATFIEIGIG